MLCSRCSAPVRPVVAIDIDGTLSEYHGHLVTFANSWLGRDLGAWTRGPMYDGQGPFKDWFCDEFKIDVTTFRAIKLAYRQGGMKRTQPLVLGAAQMVNTLRAQAEVWLTTTRPHDRFDRVDPDTREWLRRHDIGFDGLLYHDNKMCELEARVDRQRVVAVLDDQHDILEDARARGLGAPIKMGSEYNSAWPWSLTANGLIEAHNMINVLLEDWTRRYG